MSIETNTNEFYEIKNVKFYDDGNLYHKMKTIEEHIYAINYFYENKIKGFEERINYVQNLLNEIDNHSLIYEDDSDEYYRDQVFDEVASVSRKIKEEKLNNDNALGLPFKEYNHFYWRMKKIIKKFYKKMENVVEL